MIEILPIKFLRDEDSAIFGALNVKLSKLLRDKFPVAEGFVISPPALKLKTSLEHFEFKDRELFEQKLILVKKDMQKIPVPEKLLFYKKDTFLVNGQVVSSIKSLWFALLDNWLDQIKNRIWKEGFSPDLVDNLESIAVFLVKNPKTGIESYYDPENIDVIINHSNSLQPKEAKLINDLTILANKKLLIPHNYKWIIDTSVKMVGIEPYTPFTSAPLKMDSQVKIVVPEKVQTKSTIKIFYDLSGKGLVINHEVDGIFIDSGKIFDLENPKDSFDELAFKLIESATTFENSPILFKLADIPEKNGGVRGVLRLIHQKNLLQPLLSALIFASFKKSHKNIHLVIPFLRNCLELQQIKRELAAKNIHRKNSFDFWMEADVPENLLNIEDYLDVGVDGVVLNLDELVSHLVGFDYTQEEVSFYKKETSSLVKFLEDGIRTLHKNKIPFLAFGKISLYPEVLHFLVEKGVKGLILEKFEVTSAHQLIQSAEKRVIFSRVS